MKKFNKKLLVVAILSAVSLHVSAEESSVGVTIDALKEKVQGDLNSFSEISDKQKEISLIEKRLRKISNEVDIKKKEFELLEIERDIKNLIEEEKKAELKKEKPKIDINNFMKFDETYNSKSLEEDFLDPSQSFGVDNAINYNYSESGSSDDNFVYEKMNKFNNIDTFRSPLDKGTGSYDNFTGYEDINSKNQKSKNKEVEKSLTKEEMEELVNGSIGEKFNELREMLTKQIEEANKKEEVVVEEESDGGTDSENNVKEVLDQDYLLMLENNKNYNAKKYFISNLKYNTVKKERVDSEKDGVEYSYTFDFVHIPNEPPVELIDHELADKGFYKRIKSIKDGDSFYLEDIAVEFSVIDKDTLLFTFIINNTEGLEEKIKESYRIVF